MPQGEFHHLAQLVERITEAADIVVGDAHRPGFPGLYILGQKLHFRVGSDHDDSSRRRRRYDKEPDFVQAIGALIEQLAEDLVREATLRHSRRSMIDRRGHNVAGHDGALVKGAFQAFAGALKPHFLLRRRQHYAGRNLGVGGPQLDLIAA